MFGDCVSRILLIDASTEGYPEEEVIYEEEEGNFDQYTDQARPIGPSLVEAILNAIETQFDEVP